MIQKTFKIILQVNIAKDLGPMALVDPFKPLIMAILYKKHEIAKTINYNFALFIFILKFLNDNCNKR